MSDIGIVYLVGAGPGDPGLITLRGVECLRDADLVLYDGLVNPLLLRHTRGTCERTARTRRGGELTAQQDVNMRMIAAAREGQIVVRLKGGDPFIFGRGGEEAAALAGAGVPFEVVPGITAATAAAVCSGISLTHRDFASAVTFVTGHEDHGKSGSKVDYTTLARISGTLVFYMGLDRADAIARDLMNAGKPGESPAAIICQATLPTQRSVFGPLKEIARLAREADLHPPSLIIVGEVLTVRQNPDWLLRRPLAGVSIGLARAEEQLEPVLAKALALGADPVPMPLIEIGPPDNWDAVDSAIRSLGRFDFVAFTSVNGVRSFLGRLGELGFDSRSLAGLRIAVIGPATGAALREFGLKPDIMPGSYRAEALAECLSSEVAGKTVLWARANRGRDVLPQGIAAAGGRVAEVIVYQNHDVERLPSAVEQRLLAGGLQWIALSSPSIARGVARVLKPVPSGKWPRFAAISPVTAMTAGEVGLTVDAIATEFTWDGLFAAISGSRSGPAVVSGT